MKPKKTTAKNEIIPAQPITNLLVDPSKNLGPLLQRVFDQYGPNTRRAFYKAWQDFAAFRGLPDPEAALRDLLSRNKGTANAICLDYEADMKQREPKRLAPKTIDLRLSAIRSIVKGFFIMGVVEWRLDFPMAKRVKVLKDVEGPGYQAIETVLDDLAKKDDPISIRDRAIIWLLWSNALRREEIASLDLEHVDWRLSRIYVLRKGEVERHWLTIPMEVLESIRKWVTIRGEAPGSLFKNFDPAKKGDRLTGQSIYRMVRGCNLMRPHAVRHSSGTRIAELTKDPYATKEHLGHKGLDMALNYLDHLKNMAGKTANMLASRTKADDEKKGESSP